MLFNCGQRGFCLDEIPSFSFGLRLTVLRPATRLIQEFGISSALFMKI